MDMKTIIVRYETKPERADENQKLVEAVFDELREKAPEHFGYASLRLEDGVSFVHLVVEKAPGELALNDLDAFKRFTENIADRCVVQPQPSGATIVGNYNLL
jgi:hypothetical protein